MSGRAKRAVDFTVDNSLLLIGGALAALLWANWHPGSYPAVKQWRLTPAAWPSVTLQYLVNDVLMAFFFALAGKEVWTALLPGGSLRRPRHAAIPILCAVGGMAGPASIFLLLTGLTNSWALHARGWAIPCATDIAFSYLVARLVFGREHPAVAFLLLLAIVDDALGLAVLAVFYPTHAVEPLWLALPAAAVGLGFGLRWCRARSFWWYLAVPGTLSWAGFALAGLHPALGLLPVIPTLPHAHQPERPHWSATHRTDTLDRFEAWWKRPVEIILGLFGLFNAGVLIDHAGPLTWIVAAALVAGKPIGIFLSGWLAAKLLHVEPARGVGWRGLFVIGCAGGIGFTVALFVATVAFPAGASESAAKMGALASGAAVFTTVLAARLLRVGRWEADRQSH